MNRFKTITHIRKGARDDHAHGVIEVSGAHLVIDADGFQTGFRKVDLGCFSVFGY